VVDFLVNLCGLLFGIFVQWPLFVVLEFYPVFSWSGQEVVLLNSLPP
jgi:hypothetical protein